MISIIIPVYNQAKKLPQCLDSILKQNIIKYSDTLEYQSSRNNQDNQIEIIIINDGSTDKSGKVAESYQDKFWKNKIRFKVMHQKNKGAPSARNKGFSQSKGKYLLFCDADVIMEPGMLEIMLTAIKENKKIGFAYSSHYYGRKLFKFWSFDYRKLKQIPYLHSTSLMKREAFPKDGWDEKLKKLQDWDFWLTIAENGWDGIWINKVLFKIQPGGVYSNWLPSFAYKLFPFLPSVKKYKEAVNIIKKKHKYNANPQSASWRSECRKYE